MAQSIGAAKESVPRPRIQTLSDMIFGLALSIGALTLLAQRPGNIVDVTYSMLSFGFAFLILALVWLRYTRIMSVLPVENSGIVWANMLLLFLVSVEPYLFNLMTTSAYAAVPGQLDSGSATTLYALDVGSLMIILAYFMHELTAEERKLIPRDLLRDYRLMMYSTVVAASIFLLSALPVFWSLVVIPSPVIPLRYVLWNGVWMANVGRRIPNRTGKVGGKPA
ncbi:MAG TPA: TMEM175 family protein [Nitrososphaerales archaeon]|nr:TMEM175 family protein [Nitrososphaerales archaeon]